MDEYIKKVAEELDFNPIKHIKSNIYLNDYEISILNQYNINYEDCIDTENLIYKIETLIYEFEDNDLEDICKSISERNYYMNTKK